MLTKEEKEDYVLANNSEFVQNMKDAEEDIKNNQLTNMDDTFKQIDQELNDKN